MTFSPTPYPAVNDLLAVLLPAAREILGERRFGGQFVGMYLDGSLTTGAFDEDSDIDFVVVTAQTVGEGAFQALREMHRRIAQIDSLWAVELEGSYISLNAVRRADPADLLHPNLERGPGEQLKLAVHDETWDIHRLGLRERGITLAGPPPHTLIDPVTPAQLRAAMRPMLHGWAAGLLADPGQVTQRGYQSYVVLTMCRILYTLRTGSVTSKPAALAWAKGELGERWQGLLERAWLGRHASSGPPDPAELAETMALVKEVMRLI